MTPQRMQRIYELFEQAVRLPERERAEFLRQACGDDAALRAEVESLLAHDESYDGPLREDAGPTATRDTPSPEGAPVSDPEIEGYRIIRELSRGGQGIVYEALQLSTKRRVAIKVLHEGPRVGRSARRRFEREIELIAQLKHPDIIEIYHSGTLPDGRQYYVMDYVRGVPLHRYVRERRLTLEETLRLFARLCEGVQYAHQKGVIHRDLKPTNILVDAEGNPKVLDFGLAKLLAGPEATLVSLSQDLVGTLPYMSPEQARGNPDEIDTRTDVYALGVILYELLTGHYPYPVVGQIINVLKHITETPPTPPSRAWKPDSGVTLRTRSSRRRLRSASCPIDDEVETIVLRALAKERQRRYQSAGELARDIQHYLAGEPIEAKRDSRLYVLRKALLRHRVASVSAALLLLVLVQTAVISLFLAQRRGERLNRLRQAIELYNAAIAFEDRGATEEAIRRYQQAVVLAPEVPNAWFNLGNALRDAGRIDEATEAYGRASLLNPTDKKPLANLALMLLDTDAPERAIPVLEKLSHLEPQETRWLALLADASFRIGDFLRARRACEQILAGDPHDTDALNNLALLWLLNPDHEARDPQRALLLAKRAHSLQPGDGNVASTWALASLLTAGPQDALPAVRRALEFNGPNVFDLLVLAHCLEGTGSVQRAASVRKQAEETLAQCGPLGRAEVTYLQHLLQELREGE